MRSQVGECGLLLSPFGGEGARYQTLGGKLNLVSQQKSTFKFCGLADAGVFGKAAGDVYDVVSFVAKSRRILYVVL